MLLDIEYIVENNILTNVIIDFFKIGKIISIFEILLLLLILRTYEEKYINVDVIGVNLVCNGVRNL